MSDSKPPEPFLERRSSPAIQPFAEPYSKPAPRTTTKKAVRLTSPHHLSDDQAGVSLLSLLEGLRKNAWPVSGFIAAVLVVTTIVTWKITPLYESSVSVKVEKRGNSGFIGQQAAMPSGSDSDQLMTTQLELIQSDPVLRPATLKYHLLDLERQFRGLNSSERQRKLNAPIKLRRLKVVHVPNTYILRISYRAASPQLAADVVNLIAQSYIAHAFDTRDRSYDQVAVVVDRQLADLRQKMADSVQALAGFERELNVVDPGQRINMLSTRLQQLSSDYTAAQAERLRKEAIFDAAKSGTLAAVQTSEHAEALERTIERLSYAKQQFALVRTTYGENHPEYKKSLGQLRELEAQLQDLQANTLRRVEIDYQQALSREQMSHGLVTQTKSEVDRLAARSYAYQQLKSESDNYKKLYEDLQRVTREEEINRSFQDAIIQISDPARPAAKHISPSLPINLSLAFILATLGGVLGSVFFETFDSRLNTPDDAVKQLHVDVIATVPQFKKLSALKDGDTRRAALVGKTPKTERTKILLQYQDSIRILRNAIDLSEDAASYRSILLTSAVAGEGKSTIAANLAFSFAMLGRKVLIIDADLRRPSLHTFFEKPGNVGLAEVLAQTRPWKETLVKVAREHLYLMPAGIMLENSSDSIHSGLAATLARAYDEFDLVLIDGPPVLGIPESLQLAASADGVLMVARAGSATVSLVTEASEALSRARANVLGLVMNHVKDSGSARAARYHQPSITDAA